MTYARFASHLSMPFLKDGTMHHPSDRQTVEENFAAIIAFATSSPRLRRAQQDCRLILGTYKVGREKYDSGKNVSLKDAADAVKNGSRAGETNDAEGEGQTSQECHRRCHGSAGKNG